MKKQQKNKIVSLIGATILSIGVIGGNIPNLSKSVVAKADGEATQCNAELKTQTINDFIKPNQQIIQQRVISDFEGNSFQLYELSPTGYAIYSVKNEASVLIEGSFSGNSPFLGYETCEVRYLGFGSYYYQKEEKFVDILTGKEFLQHDLAQGFYLNDDAYYTSSAENTQIEGRSKIFPDKTPIQPDENDTINIDGFTCIRDYEYFQNLTKFPRNTKGTCSLVALSILLGYYDEYVDDGFIPSNRPDFKNGTGTSQALHDYLFDNCLHTIFGIGNEDGYPMATTEIKESMKDYMRTICDSSLANRINYKTGSVFYTHAKPREYIDDGYPTLITMTNYKSSVTGADKESYHTVVAYGYNATEDQFLVHIGWWPGSVVGAQVVVSEATIFSYNAFYLD